MSEFEMFEALMISVEISVLASMNFLAIMVAYIVAAYIAGKQIPTSIAFGTSFIYTIFLLPPVSGVIGNLSRAYEIGGLLSATYSDSPLAVGANMPLEVTLIFTCIPMFAGWLGSIYFMHIHIRGKNDPDA